MAFGQYLGYITMVAGGIIGGVIGSIFPGIGTVTGITVGASLGGMLGGIAGQVLWPEKIDLNLPPPPQPHEARAQISTYGAPIPIVYESARLAGNIIYMQDVNQSVIRTSHRQDGVRYYEITSTYTSTFAIAFCEGPVTGINRIWVNHKVFADFRDPTGPYYPTGSLTLASANLATSIARAATYFTIYTGTEAQTADPTLSALLTAAETPAYRGICYIVFIDFPVGEFSGLPLIEVEIGPQFVGEEIWNAGDDYSNATYNKVYNCRTIVVPSRNVGQCKFKFEAHPTKDTLISGASVGIRDGLTNAFGETPTRITFGGAATTTILAGSYVWSDWMDFTMLSTSNYLVHVYQVGPSFIYSKRFIASGKIYYDITNADETLSIAPTMSFVTGTVAEFVSSIEGR